MPWTHHKRDDKYADKDVPCISIDCSHFGFNSTLSKLANLSDNKWVEIYVDKEDFKLGFEFKSEETPSSFSLSQRASSGSYRCSSQGLATQVSWVKAVTKISESSYRRFTANREKNIWVIQLAPSFEKWVDREGCYLPAGISGIYRYKNKDGKVVYIGKGDIRKRFDRPERKEWDFCRVEYSPLEDDIKQQQWEYFWIERFKEENDGNLPIYNRISGIKTK